MTVRVIVVQYKYDAWGNHEIRGSNTTLGNLNPFRYRSYYFDNETGLYYLQTRYYDPEVGRFINTDSIGYADPESINGLNLYAYCNNNPVMYIDPNGTVFFWIIALIIIGATAVSFGTASAIITSKQEGATGGDIALSFFKGFFIGAAIAGAAIVLFGTVGSIFGFTVGIKLAALGAAAFDLGIFGLGALFSIETPDPIEFPNQPEIPTFTPPITNF